MFAQEVSIWLEIIPWQWYKRFDTFIISIGFVRCEFDPYVYVKVEHARAKVFLLLYIYYMLLASKDMAYLNGVKRALTSEYDEGTCYCSKNSRHEN